MSILTNTVCFYKYAYFYINLDIGLTYILDKFVDTEFSGDRSFVTVLLQSFTDVKSLEVIFSAN